MRTLADMFEQLGYTTLKNSGPISLVGFANESLVDIVRLGLSLDGKAYCVKVDRYDTTNGTKDQGYMYCGTSLDDANSVYARHVNFRL